MSTQEHHRNDETRPEPAAPAPPPEKVAPSAPTERPKQGLKYVFKIAPADPKNSFDFEDVADK